MLFNWCYENVVSLIMMAMMMMIPLMLVQMTVMLFPANKQKNTVVDETCAAGFGVSLCFVTSNDSKL